MEYNVKSTDLMIGDWVGITEEYEDVEDTSAKAMRVSGLNDDMGDISVYHPDNTTDIEAFPDWQVRPIRLTEEIMVANGFELVSKVPGWTSFIHPDNPRYHFAISNISVVTSPNAGRVEFGVHYVHELQHALTICGLGSVANHFQVPEQEEHNEEQTIEATEG